MCRLYGFRSAIVSGVHRSLIAAENALALQSEKHSDGWGLAHYIGTFPHLIRNKEQAVVDSLYREVSGVVATRTFLAHIRKATVGEVNVLNCHPFQHGPWTFAHNGEIAGFDDETVRADVRELVDGRFRRHILGATDSELVFHIFLSQLARDVESIHEPGVSTRHVVAALRRTVKAVLAVSRETDEKRTKLSFLVTNGNVLVGYRHRCSLYFSTYKTHCPERDACLAYEAHRCEAEVVDGIVKHLIIASEVITGDNVWHELEDGEFVAVNHAMNFQRGRLEAA